MNEHEYKDDPDAKQPLRGDVRIKIYEANARSTESQRNAEAQVSKAKGSTADTFTEAELRRCSLWCLQLKGTPQQVHNSIRDRAMLLLSTSMALRGDNTRALLLSDLYLQDVPLYEVGSEATETN
ncbi:hypothetical protein H0H92_016155 [Tricholoma furcatifolium]|nr:hypothetical protein H0H92_016155 [Tricholoma furcatifolium]